MLQVFVRNDGNYYNQLYKFGQNKGWTWYLCSVMGIRSIM